MSHHPITSFAIMTVAGISAWSGPMLASAAAGVYRAEYFGLLGWTITLCALIRLFKHTGVLSFARSRLTMGDWAVAVGLLVAASLYLGYPSESILGGRDEGVYANHGVYIAHHGRLDVPYPWPNDLGSVFSPGFKPFPGFYQTHPTMKVQFAPLLPLWLAQAFSTLGHSGLFRLNGIFALLSASVFYGVCRSVLSRSYAVPATLFLAFNPGQIWIARNTLSEILAQLFIWSGLLALIQALKSKSIVLARWAGVFLGLSVLVRIDSLLLVPMLFLSHIAHKIVEWPTAKGTSSIWYALYQTGLPMFALSLSCYAVFSTPYFHDLYPNVKKIAVAGAIFVFVLATATPGALKRISPWLTSRVTLLLFSIALLAVAAYGYWIRPQLDNPDQRSLVNLAQYLSPLVVWTAILGWLVTVWSVVRKRQDVQLLTVLVIVAAFSTFYLSSPRISPDHFWAVRRFVPVVIPGFVCFGAIGTWWLAGKLPKSLSVAAGIGVLAFLVGFTVRADTLIIAFAENKGYFAQLKQLAEMLPKETPILAYGPPTWTTPLYFSFDHHVITLNPNSKEGQNSFNRWISNRIGEMKPVYLLHENDWLLMGLQYSKVHEVILSRFYTEPTFIPLPQRILREQSAVNFYRITGTSGRPDYRRATFGMAQVWGLEESGFYYQEWNGGSRVRWTNGAAKLVIPLQGLPPPRTLRVDIGTVPKETKLQLSVNGRKLFNKEIPSGPWSNTFNIAGLPLGDRATIQLLSDTFVPRRLMGTPDTRTLGVPVRGIRLRQNDQPAYDGVLTPRGYRSFLKLREKGQSLYVTNGQGLPLKVTVGNVGNATWQTPGDLRNATGSVRLGILWFAQGQMHRRLAEYRVELGQTMFPGDEVEIDALLEPISYDGNRLSPGTYEVWIGLVQEHVIWFYDKGDAVLKLTVEVRP